MKRTLLIALALLVVTASGAFWTSDALAVANIVIVNLDGPGEGFNDPTPVPAVGMNPQTTLGEQRLFAFQYAAGLWAQCINSTVIIYVGANMDPLFCNASSAILGGAGTNSVFANFPNAPIANIWYGGALADALAAADLNPGFTDIGATFNSDIDDDPACLGGTGWYYGVDGNPGAGQFDFVTVVLHEIGHGLGFQTFIAANGALFSNRHDTFEWRLYHDGSFPPDYPSMSQAQRGACNIGDPDLTWNGACVNTDASMIPLTNGMNGGRVRMFGPNPYQNGSSVSHFSTAVFPNELMEPFYTGANHSPSLALSLMKDIGWTLDPKTPVAVAITSFEVSAGDGGVAVSAEFLSDFNEVTVNVYRGESEADLTAVHSVTARGGETFRWVDVDVDPGKVYTYRVGVRDEDGEFYSAPRSVTTPTISYALDQNVPNPFNPTTTISYTLPDAGAVKLSIYDASGRLVRTLVSSAREHGSHAEVWDGTDSAGRAVSSGIYFYRLDAGKFSQSRKMVLLK